MEVDKAQTDELGRLPLRPSTSQTEARTADRWLNLVVSTADSNQALEYVQNAVDLDPDDPRVRASLLKVLEKKLARDPFVAYLAETSENYVISFRNSRPIVIPKGRPPRELFPPVQRTESERTLGMIWWVVLGLVPAGLGALIFSPIVMQRAFTVLGKGQVEASEKRIAWLTIFLAVGLGCLGELFSLLFILHLIG